MTRRGRKVWWTLERVAEVRRLADAGLNARDGAARLSQVLGRPVSLSTLFWIAGKNGIHFARAKRTAKQMGGRPPKEGCEGVLRALGNRLRWRAVCLLGAGRGAHDLAAALEVQGAVAHGILGILARAGLVRRHGRRPGKDGHWEAVWALDRPALGPLIDALDGLASARRAADELGLPGQYRPTGPDRLARRIAGG